MQLFARVHAQPQRVLDEMVRKYSNHLAYSDQMQFLLEMGSWPVLEFHAFLCGQACSHMDACAMQLNLVHHVRIELLVLQTGEVNDWRPFALRTVVTSMILRIGSGALNCSGKTHQRT